MGGFPEQGQYDSLALAQLVRNREVHVWHMELAAPGHVVVRARRLLAPDEMERAIRFRDGPLRDAFVLARAGLRAVLARYAGVAASRIEFELGAAGKPSLRLVSSILRFNVSHTSAIAAYAVTLDASVGVDVERMRSRPDYLALAERFFCTEECADLRQLPDAQREAGFYECWVRKEAFVKAVGLGLTLPLDSFRVTLRPEDPPAVRVPAGGPGASGIWTMHAYRPVPDHAGAVAWQGGYRRVRVCRVRSASEMLSSAVAE